MPRSILSAGLCLAQSGARPLPSVLAALLSLSGLAEPGVAFTRAGPPAAAPHPTALDAALWSVATSFGG
ncbi:hypothetical protein [Methylobacterium sp. P5_C11]